MVENGNAMKVFLVAGARPNFMKIAPIWFEMKKYIKYFQPFIIHTGQHYDKDMSEVFFEDLMLPKPDISLGIASGSHAQQTAKIMIEFERVCIKQKPGLIIVVGDVNSTLACSMVAAKLFIPIAHVEAGLRSFDKTMPEEINRIVTDSFSTFLFTTCEEANENLEREGISKDNIYFVGNVMIDTLLKLKSEFNNTKRSEKDYAVLTLHRPSNVDNKQIFKNILESIKIISEEIAIIFPAHPRTQKQIECFGYQKYFNFIDFNSNSYINPKKSINLLKSLSYSEFLKLMINSKFVLTDSGGIQEEATILEIPCLTLRKNTERPITIRQGTNILVGVEKEKIIREAEKILKGSFQKEKGRKKGKVPKFWDGKASQRIVEILLKMDIHRAKI